MDIADQVKAILWPPGQEKIIDGRTITVRFDAYWDLAGVLLDMKREGGDPVCIRTIERVQAAIFEVGKAVNHIDGE